MDGTFFLFLSKSSRTKAKQIVQIKKYSVNKMFGNFKKASSNIAQYTKKNIPPTTSAIRSNFNFFIIRPPPYTTQLIL